MNDPIDATLARLSRYLVGDCSLADTLSRVCRAALLGIPPAVYAGISMTVDGKLGTYVFSDPAVVEIDHTQYEDGQGPCVDAFRSGKIVIVRSTRADGPYARFRDAALRHGIGSVLALPLIAERTAIGALNMFARQDDAFDARAVRDGTAFAEQAAFVLANCEAYWEARNLSENLTSAMATRAPIEQAKGIIMHSTGVGSDEAFETLRSQSQHQNVKVRDLASEIVEQASRDRPRGSRDRASGEPERSEDRPIG
jgi:GAF domain-containing protein